MGKHLNLRKVSFLLPIASNPSFAPSNMDGFFNAWKELGIGNIGDLYVEGTFASFEKLRERYDLPWAHRFRYFQIRDYVREHLPGFENAIPDKLDGCLKLCTGSDHVISLLYDRLQGLRHPSTARIKSEWERELGLQIPDNTWDSSLEQVHTCSLNARHRLIQFKVLHRIHYSKVKLHNIFPEVSPLCDKCKSTEADLLHSFALCAKLQDFWADIFRLFSKIFKVQIQPEPVLIILGISDLLRSLRVTQQRLLSYGLITAKKLILMCWKGKEVHTCKRWLTRVDRHPSSGKDQIFNKRQN